MLKEKRFHIVVTIAVAVVMLGGVAMTGCSSDDDIPAELIAIWELQGFIVGGTETPVDDPTKYTVDLQSDGNTNIRADCNNCSGTYTVDGNDLSFGTLACTIAACPPGSFDIQFQQALGTVSRWEIVDGFLFLNHDGGQLRLRPQPTLF
jgi:heat shock protein HslJ